MKSSTLSAVALLGAAMGCTRGQTDAREWRASDHDQEHEPASASGLSSPSASVESRSGTPATAARADGGDARTSWNSLCAGCHGQTGTDNRVRLPAAGVKDLTDPNWQKSVSDSEIARAILAGRGQMPPFALPPDKVADLTRLIRSFEPRK